MGGEPGEALSRGVARLGLPPYTAAWLRADVSFEMQRIFTNYSGDASGRFIELASLTSPKGVRRPSTLDPVVSALPGLQKADGHFGAEVDLRKPLTQGGPVITLLWGNARLLVGLVTAARELHRPALLAAARRLGDFYVNSAPQLCSPDRMADYRSSGTYGDSYTCCYFPAIEGLVMLYRATHDARYLSQAERMAGLFRSFDALPIDHSHGNLCAWRGILDLYDVTRKPEYLAGAKAKWRAAVQGGFVWPIGGIGEHWYVSYNGDEGCSESDWLRFNLELWRHTRDTRYLDMAERLVENQYIENQCANGGFGYRSFESGGSGPCATSGVVQEWNFCCSFHGPLGLFFLKSYLATGSADGIDVNFPCTFSAPVRAGGSEWRVSARAYRDWPGGACECTVTVSPAVDHAAPVALRMRMPSWAEDPIVARSGSRCVRPAAKDGYLLLARGIRRRTVLAVRFRARVRIEARRFRSVPAPTAGTLLHDVTLTVGPKVLSVVPARGGIRPTIVATVDPSGRLDLPRGPGREWRSLLVDGDRAGSSEEAVGLGGAQPVVLRPSDGKDRRRQVFALDVLVVPARTIPVAARRRMAAYFAPLARTAPVYGADLENDPDVWEAPGGWRFTHDGLLIDSGDVGLIEGTGYKDYRFEFDVRLPEQGTGITGWVVRSQDTGNCVMFQIQSADTTYSAPEYKTRPNTLRPHVRRDGAWTIMDPVPLPVQVRRGETHHVAVECVGSRIAVYLDGRRVCEQDDAGYRDGAPGFRVGGGETGLFSHISLRKLP
jgi:hypothetical protein